MKSRFPTIVAAIIASCLSSPVWAFPAPGITPLEIGISPRFSSPPWAVDLRAFIDGPKFAGPAEAFAEYQLGLRRSFVSTWWFSASARLQSTWSKEGLQISPADPFVELGTPALGEFGSFRIEPGLRYFVPVSSYSRRIGSAGIVAPSVWMGILGRKWEFGYTFTPTWFVGGGSAPGPKSAHRHLFEAGFRVVQTLRIDAAFYPAWTRLNGNEGTRHNELPLALGITYFLSKDASISPYLETPLKSKNASSARASVSARFFLL